VPRSAPVPIVGAARRIAYKYWDWRWWIVAQLRFTRFEMPRKCPVVGKAADDSRRIGRRG